MVQSSQDRLTADSTAGTKFMMVRVLRGVLWKRHWESRTKAHVWPPAIVVRYPGVQNKFQMALIQRNQEI